MSDRYKKRRKKSTASSGNSRQNGPNRTNKPTQKRQGRSGGGFKKSTLDPNLLVKKATPQEVVEFVADREFKDFPINPKLKQSIAKKGYKTPTEIQDRTIESLINGRDLLGIAQTGSGKTAAFLIPIIHHLLHNNRKPFALVVVPTRELATQVEQEFQSMSKGTKLYSACFIGGTNINRDLHNLRRSSHIVIATPGRLLDLVSRGGIDLGAFNTLVLDEFDRMLDMGFVNDVKRILKGMTRRRHTMLFSATLDPKQETLISTILHKPVTVKVTSGDTSSDHIDQDIIRIKPGEDKFQILRQMLEEDSFRKVLVFEETKHRVNRLTRKLNSAGITSVQIHGNKSQSARQKALNDFKQGKVNVLVATDVAARGIDVSDVTHVINYQVPQTMDSYIHRIGRTGRAGNRGKAFTFVD